VEFKKIRCLKKRERFHLITLAAASGARWLADFNFAICIDISSEAYRRVGSFGPRIDLSSAGGLPLVQADCHAYGGDQYAFGKCFAMLR
jgi:hypothetical protein